MKLIDITGQRFGRLTVVEKGSVRPSKTGGSNWICLCDCGVKFVAIGSNIRKGDTTSCGCANKERAAKMGANPAFIAKRAESSARHGNKRRCATSLEYKTWLRMKRRCYNPRCKDYPGWGGRGIRVCDRWNNSFENFLADMGSRPSPLHTIDRLDPNKNYEPGNCRWATRQEQGQEHKRGLVSVEINGVRFESIKAACRAYEMPYTTSWQRIKSGYQAEDAIKTPVRGLPNTRRLESYLRKKSSDLP